MWQQTFGLVIGSLTFLLLFTPPHDLEKRSLARLSGKARGRWQRQQCFMYFFGWFSLMFSLYMVLDV